MAMQRQDPGRDGGQPRRQRKRRSLPDCDAYMRTGVCVLGMTCLFNHPPKPLPEPLPESFRMPFPHEIEEMFQGMYQEVFPTFLAALTDFFGTLSAGDIHSHNTGPSCSLDPSSSSSAPSFSLGQRGDCGRLDSSTQLESVNDALLPDNKASMEQEELATPSTLSAYFSAGDIYSHDTGPCCSLDPSSSSSAKYFSAVDVVQRGGCSSLGSSSELEGLIRDSKVHWSELSSSNDSDGTGDSSCENFDNVADGNGESNREIFESLRQQSKY